MPTPSDIKFILNKFNIRRNRISLRPNWIDTDHFNKLSQSKYDDRILFVGRFEVEKNIPLLLEAIKNTSIGVDFVGDGKLKIQINDLIKQFKLDANFLGKIPNNSMPSIYNQYPVYILCSKFYFSVIYGAYMVFSR